MVVEKMHSVITRLIGIVAFLLFTMILMINVGADFTEFTWKKDFLLPNIVLIAAAGLVWHVIARGGRKRSPVSAEAPNAVRIGESSVPVWPIVPCTVLLFFLQLWICYSIFFETGWDPAAVTAEVRNIIDDRGINWQWYFQAYPNNLTLAQAEYWILRANRALNLFRGDYELMALAAVNCLLSSLTCMLVYLTGRRMFSENAAVSWILWGLAVLLAGLSPWMVIAYTDSMGLIFPILDLYLYLRLTEAKTSRGKIFGWAFLLILGYCGYRIKPQALIMLIAIGIAELLRNLRPRDAAAFGKTASADFAASRYKKWMGLVLVLVIVGIAIMGIRGEQNHWQTSRGFVSDSEKSMDPLHYLNMGLNTEQDGAFLQSDLDRSAKFGTKAERDHYNLQSAGKRMKAMGANGLLKHLVRKMMVVYADGTFAWGCEPDFWQTELPETNGAASRILRAFYYEDGAYYRVFETMEQAVWIFVLVGGWISSLKMLRKKGKSAYYAMALALIGITVFEILFEARARYLYLYAPVFVLMTGYSGLRDGSGSNCQEK